jgi:hypothetical protein
VQGELFVVFSFVWWSFVLCLSLFCLGCVEPLPLPKGIETCLFQVILIFAFPFAFAFDCLLKFLLLVSFLFLFSLVTQICVVRGPVDGRFLV